MEERPTIRGAWTQSMLRAIERERHGRGDVILQRVPAEVLREVEARGRLAWIPIEHHLALLNAVHQSLEPDDAWTFFVETSVGNLRGSMLKSAVLSALRLFGAGPMALVRMFPKGYSTIVRDCGELTMTTGDGKTEALLAGLPEVLRASSVYASTLAAVFQGCLVVGEVKGTVTVDDSALAEGRVRYRIRADDPQSVPRSLEER